MLQNYANLTEQLIENIYDIYEHVRRDHESRCF